MGMRLAVHMMNEEVLIADLHKHTFNATTEEAEFLEHCMRKHK